MRVRPYFPNQETCHQNKRTIGSITDTLLYQNVTEAFGRQYSSAMYRLACRLLLPKDFNYNNLLEAYNPVSQDGKAGTLLATCHTYK